MPRDGTRIHGLAASVGVRLRAKETDISAAPCALRPGKDFTLIFTTSFFRKREYVVRVQ